MNDQPRTAGANKRNAVQMTDAEVVQFLHDRRTMSVATHNPDGSIHVVGMWYGFVGDQVALFTYGRSQKVRNVERNDRITCFVEEGQSYDCLKGVQLVGRARVITDPDVVVALGEDTHRRYMGALDGQARAGVVRNSAKRVAVVVDVERTVTWDHTKATSY